MMYKKAQLFGDEDVMKRILKTTTPREIKALGRQVKNFNEKIWDQHKEQIVYEGNIAKFSSNPNLLKKLMETHPTRLVEASPYDTVWGVGLGAHDPQIHDSSKWKGQNLLGDILTRVREDLSKPCSK